MRRRGELGPPDVRRAIFFSFFEFASDVAANSAHLMSGGPSFFSFFEFACDVAANLAHLMSGGPSLFSFLELACDVAANSAHLMSGGPSSSLSLSSRAMSQRTRPT